MALAIIFGTRLLVGNLQEVCHSINIIVLTFM